MAPAGVQPRHDPGGTLRMNGVGEREKTGETSLDRAKFARERERKREREREKERERERKRERERVTRRGVQQSLAESGHALFFTVAFIS